MKIEASQVLLSTPDVRQVLQDHAVMIRSLAVGYFGREDEDAVQDAMLTILKALPGYRGESSLKTWCYGVAMNVFREQRRRNDRQPAAMPVSSVEHERQDGMTPLSRLTAAERDARLHAVLAEMDEPYRCVLILRNYEDLSYAEIGAALSLPLGTVKSRMAAAAAKLAEGMRHFLES